jgi:hypothetical protein
MQVVQGRKMKIRGASRGIHAALAAALMALAACGVTDLPQTAPQELPPMRWDHRPEADDWTRAALLAVTAEDTALATRVPADIAAWCPGYETASLPDRRAFWVGLMSALAKHESTWNPAAAGGGGRWIGLLQISPQTARGHGCEASSPAALKDVGRDWAPFRKAAKRSEMAAWISQQPYCARG